MSSASSSTFTSTTSNSSSSIKELCVVCGTQPYDLICTCGDKFDFTCIHAHVEQIGLEFQFLQNTLGERLLQIEQIAEDINCDEAKTIVDNWKRKRLQDINDIADDFLNQISKREIAYAEIAPFRVQYDQLCTDTRRVVHEQLSSIVTLQRQVLEKAEQLETLPELLRDDIDLDSNLQERLNPNAFQQNLSTYQSESVSSLPNTATDSGIHRSSESISSAPIRSSNTEVLMNPEPITLASTTLSNETPTSPFSPLPTTALNEIPEVSAEPPVELTNNAYTIDTPMTNADQDEFEAGQTANIQRGNVIVIPTGNDRDVATVCCHRNQLLYNHGNARNRGARLTFIPDINRPTEKQIVDWSAPETIVGGGDDDWIQDIAYSTKLGGYLLLNRSRLRLLSANTNKMDEFYQFPDRSMKRVTCNDSFIYLILANGMTGQNGDEIVIITYDKEEKLCKTFRDVVLHRNSRMPGPVVGEISDIAVNNNGQIVFGFRLERRQEVGVCIYNVSNDGNEWTCVKQLLLNECWHNDLSYTPRIEWCEKFNMFVLVEFMTGHLIMLDQRGQVKGESRFTNVENRRDAPLNVSISDNDWLCVRYQTSINIHRLDDDRV